MEGVRTKFVILLLLLFLLPNAGFAWGHLMELDIFKEQSLTYQIIKNKEIRYCIKMTSSLRDSHKADEKFLEDTIERTFRDWLDGINGAALYGPSKESFVIDSNGVNIKKVDCDNPETHLKIIFGSPTVRLGIFPKIHYMFGTKNPVISYVPYDESTIADNLRHEFGHAFGLCDLYSELIWTCDSKYSSNFIPKKAIMEDNTTEITGDDQLGFLSLFVRFSGYEVDVDKMDL